MSESCIKAASIQRLLREHESKIKPEIENVKVGLYDTLVKKGSYTIEDVQFLARKFIKKYCISPLLYIDLQGWQDLDKDIVDAIYNYLDEIKQNLDEIQSDKGLSNFHEPRYRLATVLYRWKNQYKQDYATILPDMYKYLPKELQQDIYQYLQTNRQNPKFAFDATSQAQYATICSLLGIQLS